MRTTLLTLLAAAILTQAVHADARQSGSGAHPGRTALRVTIGAGAGFGVGLLAGLAAFDEARYSERKIWTTAVAGGVAGGVLAWLLGRDRGRNASDARPPAQPQPLSDQEVRALAGRIKLPGTGAAGSGRRF